MPIYKEKYNQAGERLLDVHGYPEAEVILDHDEQDQILNKLILQILARTIEPYTGQDWDDARGAMEQSLNDALVAEAQREHLVVDDFLLLFSVNLALLNCCDVDNKVIVPDKI